MVTSSEQNTDTKSALIEAAAALVAEKGFDSVSLREITGRAGANVASVKYHFGSKDALIDAVVANLITPLNEERFRRMDHLDEQELVTVRDLLLAFFEPMLGQFQASPLKKSLFCKLMGRVIGERPYEFPKEVMGQFREIASRFVPAFQKAVPGLSVENVFWHIHFSFGVMTNMLTHCDLLKEVSNGAAGDEEIETTFVRVIDFCEAAFNQGGQS